MEILGPAIDGLFAVASRIDFSAWSIDPRGRRLHGPEPERQPTSQQLLATFGLTYAGLLGG